MPSWCMKLESKCIIMSFRIICSATFYFRDEIKVVRNTSFYRAFNFSFFFTASRFILLCTFLVFGFTGEILTAEKAFLALSMFNTVRLSMTLFFPFAISQLGETRVSIKRIQDFLMLQEREDQDSGRLISSKEDPEEAVKMENIEGKWNQEETEKTLKNINLELKPGQLVAVIGPVGSGKVGINCWIYRLILNKFINF